MRGPERPLADAGLTERGQQDEVLAPRDLDVDVLVVVPVERRDGPRVADPQVDGVGVLLQGDPGKGHGALDLVEEGAVLVPQVVVFWLVCGVRWMDDRSGSDEIGRCSSIRASV